MKKIFALIISVLAFLSVSNLQVKAANYEGTLGYNYTSTQTKFFYLVENEAVSNVNLYLADNPAASMILDDSGVYYYSVDGDLKDQEFYYEVCYNDLTCKMTYSLFAKTIDLSGNKNVILDFDNMNISDWEQLATIANSSYNRSIYAIEASKFVQTINDDTVVLDEETREIDSVFEKLVYPSSYSNRGIGFSYLNNLGFKYIEIDNLYDKGNYFFPNVSFSSKDSNISAVVEIQELVKAYKQSKMNIIMRTNFITPDENLKNNLLALSSDYIIDNKINLNNALMQRYIKEVYKNWVNAYKIDGFYIEDSQLYPEEYLKGLIEELTSVNENLLIYTNNKGLSEYYLSDGIQESLLGSLNDKEKQGILNGVYDKESIKDLVNKMFGGYFSDISKYKEASKAINNFGSLSGLDVYAKFMLIMGLGANDQEIKDKLELALFTIYASSGIPRVIYGNEFLNASTIATMDISTTPEEEMICNNSKTLCYALGERKSLSWEYLARNGSNIITLTNYRGRYTYQYPGIISMANAKSINLVNDGEDGVVYLNFQYPASSNGDIEQSVFIINYSDNKVTLNKINDRIANGYTFIGKMEVNDNDLEVEGRTIYTFTEVRDKRLPNWAYMVIALVLLLLIFGTRYLLIRLLKNKRGIDYHQYSKEQKAIKKANKKNKVKSENIFETYLSDELEFLKSSKKKKANKDKTEKSEESSVIDNSDVKEEEKKNK